MEPLRTLFETDEPGSTTLPRELRDRYDGGLGFQMPSLYANFVASLDGVVAIEGADHSGRMIGRGNEADRFVMGLLRAFADAVLIGAGTLRASPDSRWTPAHALPACADEFAKLRAALGKDAEPRLVVLSASGRLDPRHRALDAGALVLTTRAGAAALRGRLPGSCSVLALGEGSAVDLDEAVSALRGEGHDALLTEGGPTVIGGLLERGLLDELFLTVSPLLAGRSTGSGRLGLVEGLDLLPSRTLGGDLRSVRRHGSHLFLRYRIGA
jgi:riboflavin biosynthesis pyrimidine reductase